MGLTLECIFVAIILLIMIELMEAYKRYKRGIEQIAMGELLCRTLHKRNREKIIRNLT